MIKKPVLGYEGLYEVDEAGSVYSLDRKVGYRIKGLQKNLKGRKLKQKISKTGYKYVTLCKNGNVTTHRVHKLVAQAFLGERPKGLQIAHLDGNQQNNSISNLKFVTPKENARHKILHGTVASGEKNGKHTKPECTPRGEKHGKSKLNWKLVKEIRKSKDSSRKLAKKYDVSKTNILDIKNNKIWLT